MTSEHFDLVIRGGTLVSSSERRRADVGVRDGRVAVVADLSHADAEEIVDAHHLLVLPGLIDTQVHFREPGLEHKEDLESGTRGAVLGGFTAVCEMPNTTPPTTTAAALADKFDRARGRVHCDVGFFVGASPENAEHLGELERLPGVPGVKIFMGSSTGSLLVAKDEDLRRVLTATRRRVAVHCEDEDRLRERRSLLSPGCSPTLHPVWRDAECALRATKRLVGLLSETNRRAHVLHCTTADEMEFLADKKGLVTIETTPQHLTLVAPDCYERLGTYAQMNPPIRDEAHRAALWRAVADGVVDVLGSDHAPHTRAEKDRGYPDTPSGMPGVQTMLAVMLEHVHTGRLSLERLVQLLAEGPARVWNMRRKGRIEVGCDADMTLIDPAVEWTIRNEWMVTKSGWTPFDGHRVHGRAEATVVRGTVVMRGGAVIDVRVGRPIEFAGA